MDSEKKKEAPVYDVEAHYHELEKKIASSGNSIDLNRVRAAFEVAERAHAGQKRKDGTPYVSHCIAASIIAAEMGLDEDSIVASLLHDCVEDTAITHEDIAHSFGTAVADLVEGVTKLTRVTFMTKEEEQMENLRKMLLAMTNDIRVILIKMADRLHNMRTMDYQTEEKQRIKSLETMEVYAPIAHRLGMQRIKWELEDLSLRYLDPEGYQAITEYLDARMDTLRSFMGDIESKIHSRLEAEGIKCSISSRIKHIYSIYRKMYAQKIDINGIFDLCAFRVITDDVTDCYAALGVIHGMFKPVPGREQLPLRAHDGHRRSGHPLRGAAAHVGDAPLRRIRRGGALEIQIRRLRREARRRGEICLGPPPARDAAGIGRAGFLPQPEDRHVRRRGVRLLPEGRRDHPPRRGDADRLCVFDPLRRGQHDGRREGERAHREL